MACKVGGKEKTVRSHLLPRALMHDIRGNLPFLVQGDLHNRGKQKLQSVQWDDDLLCDEHEKALQQSDHYAVEWIRRFENDRAFLVDGDFFLMPISRPDLLQKFVCSVVWRHAASRQNAGFDMSLGPWEWQLREFVFKNSRYNPLFIICAQRWLIMSEYMKGIAVMPHRNLGFGKRAWEFEIGGLVWILFLDRRHQTRSLQVMAANDQNPVKILKNADKEFIERPGVIDITVNMLSKRK